MLCILVKLSKDNWIVIIILTLIIIAAVSSYILDDLLKTSNLGQIYDVNQIT